MKANINLKSKPKLKLQPPLECNETKTGIQKTCKNTKKTTKLKLKLEWKPNAHRLDNIKREVRICTV